MTTDTTAPPTVDFDAAPPTADELGRAWDAVRAGRFRDDSTRGAVSSNVNNTVSALRLGAGATTPLPGPVVTVVGAHGWSGASTTALLLAETAARAGEQVRLVDAADPSRSGLVGAAVTEHGHDGTARWRRGARGGNDSPGQVRLERLDQRIEEPAAVPAAADAGTSTLTVVDGGWPLFDLMRLAREPVEHRHWLGQLLRASALVLTARASVPGVQRLAAAVAEVITVRAVDQPLAVALVGAHRLPRLLSEVVTASLPPGADPGQVVLLPARRDFAVHGVTSSDLPRQLVPAGMRLLRTTGYERPAADPGSRASGPRRRRGER